MSGVDAEELMRSIYAYGVHMAHAERMISIGAAKAGIVIGEKAKKVLKDIQKTLGLPDDWSKWGARQEER